LLSLSLSLSLSLISSYLHSITQHHKLITASLEANFAALLATFATTLTN